MPAEYVQGLLDTNIVILRRWIHPAELPAEVPISAVTLAELSAEPPRGAQERGAERLRRTRGAGRLGILQRAENEFDPSPSTPKPPASTAESAPPSSALAANPAGGSPTS
jgi:hypothetical protein